MSTAGSPVTLEDLAECVRGLPDLELLLLFGSQARGDAHSHSDWDFAYMGAPSLEMGDLIDRLVTRIGTDRVDVADLERASGLLRYRVAREGQVVFERRPGLADAFRLQAVRFWCDAAPVLQRGYDGVLAELEP